MRLKKVLISMLAVVMTVFIGAPISAYAETGPTGGSTWKILVLVLPNGAVDHRSNSGRENTTMHEQEINKVREMASNIENNWTNSWVTTKVDCKVDYTPIKTQSVGMGRGITIEAGNIKTQIDKNAAQDEYDSILVVYRAVDGQSGGMFGTNRTWSSRSAEANGATYATLPLGDDLGDKVHNMDKFAGEFPERYMMSEILESVYLEVRKNHPEINPVPYMNSDNREGMAALKNYMYCDDDGLTPHWREFTKAAYIKR